jgi:hypothetical protein
MVFREALSTMLKRTIVCGIFFVWILFPTPGCAVGVDLVFLGVLGNDAPAIENSFDARLREALSVNPDFHVIDYLTSQDYRRRIKFDDFPTVSRRLVEGLRDLSADSTVFVWVSVKSRSVKPVRRWLVEASAYAELTLTLNIYSLRYKDYAFIGDVTSSAEKSEDFIFFYPLETVHISAADQVELTGNLVNAAAFRTADLVSAVVRSEKQRAAYSSDSSGMSKYKAASISDMFNVPSVEAANVDRGRKKPASVTAPKPQPEPAPVASPPSNTKQAAPGPAEKAAPAADKKPSKSDSAAAH